MFVYGSSHPNCDGNEEVDILYGVNQWVIFSVFLFKGLVRESITTICKLYELDYECRGE